MNLRKIKIAGPGFSYDALVGRGLLRDGGTLVRSLVRGNRAVLITDGNLPGVLVEALGGSLEECGFEITLIIVEPGEKSKSLREVERICEKMSGCDRSSVVIGVGGGMVGDLSGFVAAVFHRGIPHVQIPTTLLAMVDSSIGGKTAVNLRTGKNLVGAIHHPLLVIADIETLASLPEHELRQGYAEIVKHALIRDRQMFDQLQSENEVDLADVICRNISIKAGFVSRDDRDLTGERALLNFGHTVGHAIEQASNYTIRHGDCVSLGIIAASAISVKRAGLTSVDLQKIRALLKRFGFPASIPRNIERDKILRAVEKDKKFEAGQVRFVLIRRIGDAFLSHDVMLEDIRDSLPLI